MCNNLGLFAGLNYWNYIIYSHRVNFMPGELVGLSFDSAALGACFFVQNSL